MYSKTESTSIKQISLGGISMNVQALIRTGLFAATYALCNGASAQSVIYSNMSVNDSFNYSANATWTIASSRTTGARIVSSAATNLNLGSIIAPMFTACLYVGTVCQPPTAGTTMSIWLSLFADNNNSPGSFIAQSETVAVSTVGAPYSFSFSSGTTLEAGRVYWIQSNTSSPASLGAGWAWNTQGTTGNVAVWLNNVYTPSSSFTGTEVALRVLSPVPEPAQWTLLSLSLPSLLLWFRRNTAKCGRRAKVPEANCIAA